MGWFEGHSVDSTEDSFETLEALAIRPTRSMMEAV